MTHEPFEELIAVYAVGALDGEDLARLRAHLAAGCARCEAALRDAHEDLARAVAPVPPPPHVRDALLARVTTGSAPARRRPPWLPWALATAAAVVVGAAFTGAFVAIRYEARLGQMAREVSAAREQLRREAAALELLRDPAFDALVTGQSRFAELPDVMPRLASGELPALCHTIVYE
jgi:hypothetical protein